MPVKPTMREAGFTLVELMVAITISLIVLAALTAMFVTSSRARNEITRANQQIENGRYAMQVLNDDLRLAGYYGGLNPTSIPATVPGALPDPCAIPSPLPTSSNDATLENNLTLHVQGYNNGTNPANHCGGAIFPTLTNYKVGTDVLVIRRVSSCVAGATADCPLTNGELYFQASHCNTELDVGPKYRLSINTFDRHKRGNNCPTAPLADRRRFMTHIFYIDNGSYTNDEGDAIPTLVRAELKLNGGSINFGTKTPIAEGIEELQFEYGVDSAGGDGAPDSYVSSPANTTDWSNVVAIKVFLLARSTDPSPGHVDEKTYDLCTSKPCTLNVDRFTPGGAYKRHVFETTVRLSNPAGLRQQ